MFFPFVAKGLCFLASLLYIRFCNTAFLKWRAIRVRGFVLKIFGGKEMPRKTIHLCLSSHDEVMYRSEADLIMGFNCLALAVLSTESRFLAEGFLTTHHHLLLQTDSPKEVMYRSRYAYARYFNSKYFRKGPLGEKKYFSLETDGLYHVTAALNYVLRQGLHHGISSTPFEYRHCSANAFFRKELGKFDSPELMPAKNRYLYLPKNQSLPAEKYRMSYDGMLFREDIIDTAYVEEIYITPRNFLFQMNKVMGERDKDEQSKENNMPPVTAEAIESGVPDFNPRDFKVFEQGKVDRKRMTDLDLCEIIDSQIVPRCLKEGQPASVYLLPESRRAAICEKLWLESRQYRSNTNAQGLLSGKYVTEAQLRRCMNL
ncbi:MAG: hypothetical protein IJM35_04640 [Bacteroidales bacterium]|nr:hypothetical protein [Bacteroidales bacterium]